MASNDSPKENVPEEQKEKVPKVIPVSLLTMPENVFVNEVFPFLNYKDLLRLRRVCKSLKNYSDQFLKIPKYLKATPREINDTNFTFQHYLNVNLPTTSIYLNNSSSSIFKDPAIPTFLHLHGEKITNLSICNLTGFNSDRDPEFHFFSSLPNLQNLVIDFLDCSQLDISFCSSTSKIIDNVSVQIPRERAPFPQNFRNLKSLKIDFIKGTKLDIYQYISDLLKICQNLESFKHPGTYGSAPVAKHTNGSFGYIMDYITERSQNNLSNLQYFDLEKVIQHPIQTSSAKFCRLVGLFYEHQVKLLNVPAQLLAECPVHFTSTERFTAPLVSIREISKATFFAELDNLDKVVIKSSDGSSFAAASWINLIRTGIEPSKWPKLSSLDFTITSPYSFFDEVTMSLYFFFFGAGKRREELKYLAIRFPKKFGDEDDGNEFPVPVPNPNPMNVTRACPFLSKLTLENWTGRKDGKDLIVFWEGLPLLEELKLKNCEKAGDDSFVGEVGRENPVFLGLKNLKKLTLEDLDKMPGITDKSFVLVFSSLKIKQFYLKSEKPLKSVSTSGIESLLDGNFNKSVERFPFDGWSLDAVSAEEFTKLKLKFRASHML